MHKPDRKIRITVKILTASIVVLTLSMVALRLMVHFDLVDVSNNVSEFVYSTFYIGVFVSLYASIITFLVLGYFLIVRRKTSSKGLKP